MPRLAVLCSTPLNVAQRPVKYHTSEENRVEPGKGTLEACDEAP